MQTNLEVKRALAKYSELHHIPVPDWGDNDLWGGNARVMAWRVSTHAGLHPSDQKTQELCDLLFPSDVHDIFLKKMAKGYDSLLGVTEGSAKQREIAAFCGISWTQPWCAAGHWFVAKKLCGFNGPTPSNVAYVPTMELWAQRYHILVPHQSLWLPGMSCTFVWDYAKYVGSGDHIGIIDEVRPEGAHVRYIHTDEANASGPGGDAVRRDFRAVYQISCVFDMGRLQK